MTRAGVATVEARPRTDDAVATPPAPTDPKPTRAARWSIHPGTTAVLLVGVVITSVLSLGTQSLHDTNETRLLRQRVREAATVVAAAVPNLQTPLASAAVLADATDGDATSFTQLMQPSVAAGTPFSSVSLWSTVDPGAPRLVDTVGGPTELAGQSPAAITHVLTPAIGHATVTINDMLSSPDRRIGYAYGTTKARFVVYAEAALPKNRRAAVDKNSAFADLDYAVYLGKAPSSRELLASSTGGALPQGRRASDAVPFGNSSLYIVMAARTELGGNLLARLPWLLAAVGLLLTLAGHPSSSDCSVAAITRRRWRTRTRSSTTSSAASRRRCSTACFPRRFPRSRASSSRRAMSQASRASTSAATGTT